MGARTGEEFLQGLREQPREVYIEGELVRDVTTHRAFKNVLDSLAHLYDMQHDLELQDDLTYTSPDTGDRVGTSFMPDAGLPQLVADGVFGSQGFLQQERPAIWRSCRSLLQEGARGRPLPHSHADQPASESLGRTLATVGSISGCARGDRA